jgi:hypothetical protein
VDGYVEILMVLGPMALVARRGVRRKRGNVTNGKSDKLERLRLVAELPHQSEIALHDSPLSKLFCQTSPTNS